MSAYIKVLSFHAWVEHTKANEHFSSEQEARYNYRVYCKNAVHPKGQQ